MSNLTCYYYVSGCAGGKQHIWIPWWNDVMFFPHKKANKEAFGLSRVH